MTLCMEMDDALTATLLRALALNNCLILNLLSLPNIAACCEQVSCALGHLLQFEISIDNSKCVETFNNKTINFTN